MNSRGPSKNVHIKRNFTITVASCISVIMPGDFKVVRIKQVFRFNSVRINEVPLYHTRPNKQLVLISEAYCTPFHVLI